MHETTSHQDSSKPAPPPHAPTSLKNALLLTGKILIFLFFCIHAFNVEYRPITGGLDPSWQYIINSGFDQRIEFSFTSGPLGFINYPLNIGANLDISVLIRVVWWIVLCVWFGYLLLKNRFPLRNFLIFLGLFVLGSGVSFDYAVCFVILFLLSFALFSERWLWWYPLVIALSAFLGLMKLSAALLAIASCVMFAGIYFVHDRRKGLLAGALTGFGIPLLFCLFYVIYDPSFSRMVAYVKRGLDISSGYNVAMSVSGPLFTLWLAFSIILAYVLHMAWMWKCRRQSLRLAIMYLPAIFFAFKHGFVRQDGHEIIFFTVLSLLFGLLWLFTPLQRRTSWALLLLAPILFTRLSVPGYADSLTSIFGIPKLVVMSELLEYQQTKQALDAETQEFLQWYRLPSEWQQAMGQKSVSIFPWETAYALANSLNYRPFPIIQAYSAYTAYLDSVNADFLTDPHTAPENILMEWVAIDHRHALLDVPAMWLAFYQWYDVVRHEHVPFPVQLLQRRTNARFDNMELLERREYRTGEFIEVPEVHQPVIMTLSMELGFVGKLAKIFFRIPEVTMDIVGTAGDRTYRIVPETLSNPVFINALPVGLQDLYTVLNHDRMQSRVYGFVLSGPGRSFYKKTIQVEFYRIPNIRLSQDAVPDLNQFTFHSEMPMFEVEKMYRYTPETPNPQSGSQNSFLIVEGWAVDAQARKSAGNVYLEIDDRLYAAYYGFPRGDIAERFQIEAYHASGFQIGIPISDLGKGRHTISVKILSHDRQGYFSSVDDATFELQ
jgi:hypothetical protein